VSAFRSAVEAKDLEAMEAALAPDVTFRSPVVFKPYRGREAVMHLLRNVVEVFEDFRYVDQLAGENTEGLVFRARAGEKEVEGWDYLTVGDDGLVTELVVMVRPLSGAIALAEAMGARLAEDPAPA
jgi:hypothetical protein